MTDYGPEAQRAAGQALAATNTQRARNLPRGKSAHLDDDTPAGRVALFLDGREAMLGTDPELIGTISSPATDGRLVDLTQTDLRTVLAEHGAPAAVIARLVAEAVLPLLAEPDNGQPFVPDFGPAEAEAAKLTAEQAEKLAIAFSSARDVMWQAYAEARRQERMEAKS